MKLPWQKTTWEASIKANTALSISNLILVAITCAAVIHSANQKETIVLTPPRVDEKMIINWDSANEPYLKSFGMYVSVLMANITESNAAFVADSISQFVDSSVYPGIRKTILATAETRVFKEAAAGTKFQPNSVLYEPSTNKVFVMGDKTLVTSAGDLGARPVVYEMTIRIVERRPVIYTLQSYEGNYPHTEQWLKDHVQVDVKKSSEDTKE